MAGGTLAWLLNREAASRAVRSARKGASGPHVEGRSATLPPVACAGYLDTPALVKRPAFCWTGSRASPTAGTIARASRSWDDFGHLSIRRAAGKLDNLRRLVENEPVSGRQGIGHTRWATHGPASNVNAHPHTDGSGEVVVVHNGIVENYAELKARLTANGHKFLSQTDTEIIPHLIEELLAEGLPFDEAVRLAAGRLRGAHAITCMHARTPETLVAVRIGNAGGIAVSAGDGEMLIASDLPALTPYASTAIFLEPGESAVVQPEGFELRTLDGRSSTRALRPVGVSGGAAAKGGFKHFTLKEIHEQPESAMSALHGRIAFSQGDAQLDEMLLPFTDTEAAALTRVVFLGMGTSVHAGLVGARYVETLARIPASAENAAEFLHRDPVLDKHTLVVGVTQSGEDGGHTAGSARGADTRRADRRHHQRA